MNRAAIKLKAACDSALADQKLWPHKCTAKCPDKCPDFGKTHCNSFLMVVAEAVGYEDFLGKMANEMHNHMLVSPKWKQVSSGVAVISATEGCLVVASQKGTPHGHVAVVSVDGATVYSGRWQAECPVVANCGKRVGYMGANYAFELEPAYFVLTGS